MSEMDDLAAALGSYPLEVIKTPELFESYEGVGDHVVAQRDVLPRESTVLATPSKMSMWSTVLADSKRDQCCSCLEHLSTYFTLLRGDKIIIKDSAYFVKDKMSYQENATVLDEKKHIFSTDVCQIVAVKLRHNPGEPMKKNPEGLSAYGEHILVRMPEEARNEDGDRTTTSGIVIPETARGYVESFWREVIDIHPSYDDEIRVGDFVLFRDSFMFVGGAVTAKEQLVVIDPKNRIESGRIDQIVCVRNENGKIHPFRDNVLAQLDPVEDVSKGGIHIPGNSIREKAWATVVDPGDCLDVKMGDRIAFKDSAAYAGNKIIVRVMPIEVDKKKRLVVVDENLIVAIKRSVTLDPDATVQP